MVLLSPSFNVRDVWLSCMETAGTKTVTAHLACRPFADVAVMTAVPFANALTRPLLSTLATDGTLDSHATDLSEALAGSIAGFKRCSLDQ